MSIPSLRSAQRHLVAVSQFNCVHTHFHRPVMTEKVRRVHCGNGSPRLCFSRDHEKSVSPAAIHQNILKGLEINPPSKLDFV